MEERQRCPRCAGVNASGGPVHVGHPNSSSVDHVLTPFSTLNRIEHKVQEVLDRVNAAGYKETDEDVRIVSEFMDDIRDAVTDYQVSSNPKQFLPVPLFRQSV